MPLQQTSGAASYDAFGGGAPVAAKYIEDFFQTWLRTGTGSSTTVTTGLNASINKSLVWTKSRSAATNHKLTDTARGVTKALSSNTTGAEVTDSQGLTAFSSTGYTIGTNTDYNNSGATYVDWQLVATPKFFDVVTYTGNGATFQTLSHNLGSTPGCIIVKKTNNISDWWVRHRSETFIGRLNLTNTFDRNADIITNLTSTTFDVGVPAGGANTNGDTYVAYLFAHNAGGFGVTGTDNVISCGSYVGNGSANGPTIDLGYEPQWLMIKEATDTGNWSMMDNMRGIATGGTDARFQANQADAENTASNILDLTSTGFKLASSDGNHNTSGQTYIYIAIRRGPMKVPTTGTSVYEPFTTTNSTTAGVYGSLPQPDMFLSKRTDGDQTWRLIDRLRGGSMLRPDSTDTETGASNFLEWDEQVGVQVTVEGAPFLTNDLQAHWLFRRAPGFFDEVCYTGNGTSNRSVTHNLGVTPELYIIKQRNGTGSWAVYNAFSGVTKVLRLETTDAVATDNWFGNVNPSSTSFSVNADYNISPNTFVAYLFASCPGVSKVFNYTGNGSSQTINCGFTGGARFVMIKRTDSTGAWYVWDTARGIVANNDPHLSLNSTAAEVTTNDTIDTDSTGFVVNQVAATNVNVSSATYIGLAIA